MFWDSSAVVPWLLPEHRSVAVTELLGSDPELILWWASPVECQSAVYRRHRQMPLATAMLESAFLRLRTLIDRADFVAPTDSLRTRAGRLLGAHPLKAGDALQLAAALAWCRDAPRGHRFVCLDERLGEAARREGFEVFPPERR